MTTNRIAILAWLCLALAAVGGSAPAATPSPAQRGAASRVSAHLSSGLVQLGGAVRVNVFAQDVEDARIVDVPEVPGLKLSGVSSPSRESRIAYVNGRRSASTSFRWVVVYDPVEEGDYVIPPIELEVDGERVKTQELSVTVRRDMRGEELGYIEWIELPERVYEGEPFRLRLRFGWDGRTRVNYANLLLPWASGLPNVIDAPDPSRRPSNPQELNLNNQGRITVETLGEQTVDGRTLVLFELDRRMVATRNGAIEVPQSYLEFGVVEGNLIRRRKDTNMVGVDARSIEVRPLPREGQPFDFSGAVGQVQVAQNVDRRSVDVGESIKLSVEYRGQANIEFFTAPDPGRLEAFDDFRLYGTTDDYEGGRRRIVYDIVPEHADVDVIPPLPLWIFDTRREEYVAVETEPIPIRVRALEGATGLSGETDDGPVLDVGDIQTEPEGPDGPRGPSDGALVLAPAILGAGWFALRAGVRRAGDPDAPAARARRAALRTLRRELASASTASAQSLALRRFLAARSGETPEAWDGRPATQWYEERARREADEPPRAIVELDALQRELDEQVWAGADGAVDRARIESVARELVGGAL